MAMFIKPFKIKSNVQLKASDTKKLKQSIQQQFALTEADLSFLFPNKSTVNLLKIYTHNGALVNIYTVDKRPMFFEEDNDSKIVIPTLYSLWILPDLLPFFTTTKSVLPRLANGADLMLPGVIRKGTGLNSYGNYRKDQLVAVNLINNRSAVGIGRLVRSSEDLYMSNGHGPCVKLLNVFGDKLWGIEPSLTLQIPDSEPIMKLPTDIDFPTLGDHDVKIKQSNNSIDQQKNNINAAVTAATMTEIHDDSCSNNLENIKFSEIDEFVSPNDTNSNENIMDEIVKTAFLTALKMNVTTLQFPILTSNFYRNYIVTASKRDINLKQTTFKKLSKFLLKMSDDGFIVVREETKGVEKIISVNFDHPELVNFIIPDDNIQKTSLSGGLNKQQPLFHTEMIELYLVTEETIKFFTKFNFKKGDGIQLQQVKKILKDYFSKNQIPWVNQQLKILKLDNCLEEICGKSEITFDECYSILIDKMKQSYEMRGKHELNKNSNKQPIQMSLATRAGNKKVTLVTNLELYGIILSEFGKACKQGAAASTSIIKSPNQKQDVFQIQGNQVKFIHKLLTETYKINEKHIHGMDLAKKEKKKK